MQQGGGNQTNPQHCQGTSLATSTVRRHALLAARSRLSSPQSTQPHTPECPTCELQLHLHLAPGAVGPSQGTARLQLWPGGAEGQGQAGAGGAAAGTQEQPGGATLALGVGLQGQKRKQIRTSGTESQMQMQPQMSGTHEVSAKQGAWAQQWSEGASHRRA
jgi:hypothetical protein